MDLKAESEKLSKAVCGEPELELQSEWFVIQFWPVAVNSLPGSAWAGNGMDQGLFPEHMGLTYCPSSFFPLKHFHSLCPVL